MAARRSTVEDDTGDLRRYLEEVRAVPLLTAADEDELSTAIRDRPGRRRPGRPKRRDRARRAPSAAGSERRSAPATQPGPLRAGQPPPRDLGRPPLPQRRPAPRRPGAGGQPRPHAGRRELRPPQGLHVLHLRHLVDPPAHRPGPGRHRAARSASPATSPRPSPSSGASPRSCSSPSAASPRPRSSPRRRASRLERVQQCLRAEPDLVSLSAGVGEDGAELGDLLADPAATAPEDAAVLAVESAALRASLGRLRDREREVIELRYGFVDGSPRTLEEVGRRFSVTRERARQIEAKALTKLRHPCVPKELARRDVFRRSRRARASRPSAAAAHQLQGHQRFGGGAARGRAGRRAGTTEPRDLGRARPRRRSAPDARGEPAAEARRRRGGSRGHDHGHRASPSRSTARPTSSRTSRTADRSAALARGRAGRRASPSPAVAVAGEQHVGRRRR